MERGKREKKRENKRERASSCREDIKRRPVDKNKVSGEICPLANGKYSASGLQTERDSREHD